MTTLDYEFLDRILVQKFLTEVYEFLVRDKAYYEVVLQKAPGDIVAMGSIKRIDNDLVILTPLIKSAQKANLTEIEKMTGKKFAYLLENKNTSKDILKKVE